MLTHRAGGRDGAFGELLQVAHFSLVNSADPAMQQIATNSCKQLATILAPTKLAGVSDAFTKVAAGPNGSSAQIAACDEAMRKVDAYVASNYGHDGLWYFALAPPLPACTPCPKAATTSMLPEYRDCSTMLTHQPTLEPPGLSTISRRCSISDGRRSEPGRRPRRAKDSHPLLDQGGLIMRRFAATALILASLCTGPLLADRIDWTDGSTIEHSIERCAPPYRLGNGYSAYNVAWDGGPFPPHSPEIPGPLGV